MISLSPEKWTPAGFVWGFILIGALIFAAGLLWTAYTAWFLIRATQTTGVVVSVTGIHSTRSPGDDPSAKQVTSYYPVVEYQTPDGTPHRGQSTRAARSAHFSIGDQVCISHHPAQPHQFLLHDPWILWFSPGILLASGLLWLLFSTGALSLVKKFETDLSLSRDNFLQQAKEAAQKKERSP